MTTSLMFYKLRANQNPEKSGVYKVNLSDLATEEVSLRKTKSPDFALRKRMEKREMTFPSKDGETVSMTIYFDKK